MLHGWRAGRVLLLLVLAVSFLISVVPICLAVPVPSLEESEAALPSSTDSTAIREDPPESPLETKPQQQHEYHFQTAELAQVLFQNLDGTAGALLCQTCSFFRNAAHNFRHERKDARPLCLAALQMGGWCRRAEALLTRFPPGRYTSANQERHSARLQHRLRKLVTGQGARVTLDAVVEGLQLVASTIGLLEDYWFPEIRYQVYEWLDAFGAVHGVPTNQGLLSHHARTLLREISRTLQAMPLEALLQLESRQYGTRQAWDGFIGILADIIFNHLSVETRLERMEQLLPEINHLWIRMCPHVSATYISWDDEDQEEANDEEASQEEEDIWESALKGIGSPVMRKLLSSLDLLQLFHPELEADEALDLRIPKCPKIALDVPSLIRQLRLLKQCYPPPIPDRMPADWIPRSPESSNDLLNRARVAVLVLFCAYTTTAYHRAPDLLPRNTIELPPLDSILPAFVEYWVPTMLSASVLLLAFCLLDMGRFAVARNMQSWRERLHAEFPWPMTPMQVTSLEEQLWRVYPQEEPEEVAQEEEL